MSILEKIKRQIIKILPRDLGVTSADLVVPPNPAMGDLSLPCFDLAKKIGKNPAEAAKEIVAFVETNGRQIVETNGRSSLQVAICAIGPYVNFTLNPSTVAKMVLSEIAKQKTKYGQSKIGRGERVMIEYSQPNTHKEFHVGHLRNVALGSSLVNLYQASGYKALAVNYIGDVGAHVAKCLWGLERFHAKEKPPADKGHWLGQIYAEASRYVEEHPEAKLEIAVIQQKLEAGDRKRSALWKKTRKWSLDGFNKIYKELGVKFNHVFYESEVESEGKKIVAELVKKKVAEKGEGGAIIVNLKKFGLDIFLILKSDGAALYSTKDLALAKKKFQKYKISRSLHVIDRRQSLYFKQLFKTLELWGFKKPMIHIAYEFVKLPEGTMASRLGRVVLYEDLRDEMVAYAATETKKRHPDWSGVKIRKTALALALGAMKFGMLKVNPGQIITFDLKEALSFDGCTGPYLQYSVARINSIIRKSQTPNFKFQINLKSQISKSNPPAGGQYPCLAGRQAISNIEKQLLLKLADFPEVVQQSTQANDPSHLAKYLYELAKTFSDFYENCPVLKAESKELRSVRLKLIKAVKIVMEKGLGILGVPVVEEM